MPKPAFTTWLEEQSGRQDDVGDIALHYQVDAMDAPRAITVDEVRQRLHEIDALPVYFERLDQAYQEYCTEVA